MGICVSGRVRERNRGSETDIHSECEKELETTGQRRIRETERGSFTYWHVPQEGNGKYAGGGLDQLFNMFIRLAS